MAARRGGVKYEKLTVSTITFAQPGTQSDCLLQVRMEKDREGPVYTYEREK